MLFTSTHYPADYGFIPGTLAEDGDPLDIMVLVTEPTFPGCRVRVRPIGVFLMEDQGHADHKVISVPSADSR
jgi:inorganic pyrophosphatase